MKKSAVLAALAAIDRRDGIDPESGSRWSLETVDADSKIAEQPTGTVRRGRSYLTHFKPKFDQHVRREHSPSSSPTSNVAPPGIEETLRGARNRLNDAIGKCEVMGQGYVVAVENGIMETAEGRWLDFAWVIVRELTTGRQTEVSGAYRETGEAHPTTNRTTTND